MSLWRAEKAWPVGELPAFIKGTGDWIGFGSLLRSVPEKNRPEKSNPSDSVQSR